MSELSDLYQEVILDHSRHPHNYGPLAGADLEAKGHNPLCGDQVRIMLKMDGDRIADIHFEGNGCAISKSSASVMTDAVKGQARAEVDRLFQRFHELVTRGPAAGTDELDRLSAFAGVAQFPARVKCASLAWHTLKSALERKGGTTATE